MVGGRNIYEGRVEVKMDNQWQTLCDAGWDINDADVVCRELDHTYAISALNGSVFDKGEGAVWPSDIKCEGSESSLMNCYSTPVVDSVGSCGHGNEAGIICTNAGTLHIMNLK